MTRKDKCDACRKLKIKCDESLPSCSNCTKRGKECIHSESKRDFKFVDVTGETVSESSSSDSDTRRGHVGALDEQGTTKPGGGRKIALITTHRRKKPSKLQREVSKVTAANLGRLDLSCRPSETASLLARWFSMVPPQGDSSQEYLSDSYVMWSLHIPQLIGKSRAINDAARCFMDCKLALANPSDVNIRAAESSNVAAVGSVRLALIESGPQSCTNELFLSIQILVVVESLMFHTRNCMIIHVRGLLSLLKQQKDRLMRKDPKDAVIRAIFMANCAPGFYAALLDKRDHELDQPGWLDMPIEMAKLEGISHNAVQSCGSNFCHAFILLPRVIRLVRQVVKLRDEDGAAEREAIELVRTIFLRYHNTDLFYEAVMSGRVQSEMTVLPELAEEIPTSYRFRSRWLTMCHVVPLWVRLMVCSLVGTLIEVSPTAALFFDAASVYAEELRVATEGLMVVQCSLIVPSLDDPSELLAERMRLVNLLHSIWGAWCRLEARARASLDQRELSRAGRMRKLSFELCTQVNELAGLAQISESEAEEHIFSLAGRL